MEEAARARSARVFEAKAVQTLQCSFCSTELCCRGMRALLLADTATELFSTDVAPVPCSLVGDEYVWRAGGRERHQDSHTIAVSEDKRRAWAAGDGFRQNTAVLGIAA